MYKHMCIPDNMCTTQYFSVVLDLVSKLVPPALPGLLVRQGGLELTYIYIQRIGIISIIRNIYHFSRIYKRPFKLSYMQRNIHLPKYLTERAMTSPPRRIST